MQSRQTNRPQLNFVIGCLLLFFPLTAVSQNCFDADLESGTVGGYQTSHGRIDFNGTITFPSQSFSSAQHRIMEVSDGIDPIASQFCTLNRDLLTTGSGTGKYSLRLGDAENGAMTSKVVLSFDVTKDVSFFLLKYAVILYDPGHDYEVQPRFELNIKDEDGNILDCGEYKVRAAENIDGFESCDQWRVRPWTTAGFELASYIGQTINIEIISTDCGLGGHGGYAYVDATCSPLELDLESYCPGEGYAKYVVTEGFDSYLWNTGETSRILDIDNPIPGVEYQVTVTSATGCTLVLKDTLPELPSIDDLVPSYFDGSDSLIVCYGEEILFQPTGTNIGEVHAIELGYTAEEFYIFADQSQIINFVTADNLGCVYDTMQLHLTIDEIAFEVDLISSCEGVADGEIIIDNLGDNTLLTALENTDYQSVYHYTDLLPGEYILFFASANNCEFARNIIIVPNEIPELKDLIITPATCDLDNGSILAISEDEDFEFSFNGADFGSISNWDDLPGGTYNIKYKKGEDGCVEEEEITIYTYGRPILDIQSIKNPTCGLNNGIINLNTEDGYLPLTYILNENNFIDTCSIAGLSAGDYEVIVRDASDCADTVSTNLSEDPYIQLDSIIITPETCDDENGIIDIILLEESIAHEVFIDSMESSSLSINDLASGWHEVMVIDHNGCKIDSSLFIEYIPPPIFDSISYIKQICVNDEIKIKVHGTTSTDSIFYGLNRTSFKKGNSFTLIPDEYKISIKDQTGCIVDSFANFYSEDWFCMANIFSPNGDGDNDLFCYQAMDNVEKIEELYIYDRWGNKVYELGEGSFNITDICWDGKNQEQEVEIGVYVYYIKIQLNDGRLICKYGDVTLIR